MRRPYAVLGVSWAVLSSCSTEREFAQGGSDDGGVGAGSVAGGAGGEAGATTVGTTTGDGGQGGAVGEMVSDGGILATSGRGAGGDGNGPVGGTGGRDPSGGGMGGEGGAAGDDTGEGGASGGGATGGTPRCGDGTQDANEDCDDGPDNGPGQLCNANCDWNDCGDGDQSPYEYCDDGADNGLGQACNANCQLNECGDDDPGPGEACDDGDANGLTLMGCAPDCSRIIQAKYIRVSDRELPSSNFQPDPVAAADGTCPEGYKAMFAYGDVRRATTVPFQVRNPVDWVLQPYTYYKNENQNPVWVTDSVALLGVREGESSALVNHIAESSSVYLTGLSSDYTTLSTDNCNGWVSIASTYLKRYGLSVATDIGFLDSGTLECGEYAVSFYCVEQ